MFFEMFLKILNKFLDIYMYIGICNKIFKNILEFQIKWCNAAKPPLENKIHERHTTTHKNNIKCLSSVRLQLSQTS